MCMTYKTLNFPLDSSGGWSVGNCTQCHLLLLGNIKETSLNQLKLFGERELSFYMTNCMLVTLVRNN